MHMNIFAFNPKKITALAATLMVVFASYSQDTETIFKQGLALEQSFHDSDALKKFEDVLRHDPVHTLALTHASRMLSNIAGRKNNDTDKKELASRACSLARRAIEIDHHNKEAHVNYVIALALLAEVASGPREKIGYARTIKREADFLLSLDPAYAPALYILGKWHLELSTLSALEKIGCTLLFNDVTQGASLRKALECFDSCIRLEPEYILFHYNHALAQYYSGNMTESRRSINRALSLTQKEPDDAIRIRKCRHLLKKIDNAE